MNLAYVKINTEIGSEAKVTKDLNKVEGVKKVYGVYGVYDLVARDRGSLNRTHADSI